MKKGFLMKKAVSVVLSTALLTTLLTGCGKNNDNDNKAEVTPGGTNTSTEATATTAPEGSEKYKDFLTIDVFSITANFQGIQSGWFAKIVKDKFNMELNIIAPNVAGGGDTLYQTRSANGNLADLILMNADGNRLKDLVTADLVTDMTPYIANSKNLQERMEAIKNASTLAEKDGIWAIPSGISMLPATEPGEAFDPTGAVSIRWDLYKQIGYPTINTLEDLLPVMKQMQDAAGTSISGKKVYAFSLFKDWDGGMMQNAGTFASYYGYNAQNMALYDVTGSDIQNLVDSNSLYVRGLRFLFNANQMGLVDPESTSQNFDTVFNKYKDGAVLYGLWPWLGNGAFNTPENMAEGKGFGTVTIQDGKNICWGNTPLGNNGLTMMVGSKTKDPQRIVDFIDWLYSPEGYEIQKTGPKGLTWEMKDGKPVFTELGKQVHVDKKDDTAMVPEEWGGGTYKDGYSQLNFNTVGQADIDPLTNAPYDYNRWDDYLKYKETPLSQDWSANNENYKTSIDLLKAKNKLAVVPGVPFVAENYSTDVQAIRDQCAQIIVQYSWQMAFAKDENEFNKLLKEMQDTVNGLGMDQVFAVDKKNCEDRYAEIQKFLAEHK